MSYNSRTYRDGKGVDEGREGLLSRGPTDQDRLENATDLSQRTEQVQGDTLAQLREDRQNLQQGQNSVELINSGVEDSDRLVTKLGWIYKKAYITKICVIVQSVMAIILFIIVYFKLYK